MSWLSLVFDYVEDGLLARRLAKEAEVPKRSIGDLQLDVLLALEMQEPTHACAPAGCSTTAWVPREYRRMARPASTPPRTTSRAAGLSRG